MSPAVPIVPLQHSRDQGGQGRSSQTAKFLRVAKKVLLSIVAFLLWYAVILFFLFVIQADEGTAYTFGLIAGLPSICAPFPSIWLDGFSTKARIVGFVVGELVSFAVAVLDLEWLIYIGRVAENLPPAVAYFPSFFFLASIFLVPAFGITAAAFAMRRVGAAEPSISWRV